MSDKIQRILESFVPEILSYQKANLFTDEEIKSIIKTRRHFESLINSRNSEFLEPRRLSYYKKYIEYERNLLLYKRGFNNININIINSNIYNIVNLYKAAIKFFPQELELFKELTEFSLKHKICLKRFICSYFYLNLNRPEALFLCVTSLVIHFFPIISDYNVTENERKKQMKQNMKLEELKNIREMELKILKLYSNIKNNKYILEEYIKIENRLREFFLFIGLIELVRECDELIDVVSGDLLL
ncbi:hypothetical protein CDIK_1338 [Cucumispora dikerogammari]|nr:hypothetical protein CDIK_1338 [Cucumispora dikerogammari]